MVKPVQLLVLLVPLLMGAQPVLAQNTASQNTHIFTPAKTPLPQTPTSQTSPTPKPGSTTPSSSPKWLATTPLKPAPNKKGDKKENQPIILQPTLEAMLKEANKVTTYNVPVLPQAPEAPLAIKSYDKQLPEQQQLQVWTSLGISAAKLQKEIKSFHIVLLNTEDPIVRSFSAQGLLKRSESQFVKETHGLASFLLQNAIINDKKITACYVVYDASLSGHLWRNFIVPMQDIEKGTDFLMAHEVGHCLDNDQRNQVLATQNEINVEEGKKAGIEPHAWKRYAKDLNISQKTFNKLASSLLYDTAQVQYRERVADAFALLWLWKQQGPKNAIELLNKTRANQSPWASHNTGDVFKGMEDLYETTQSNASLQSLWVASRTQQTKVGVDPSVVEGPHAGVPPKKDLTSKDSIAKTPDATSSGPKSQIPSQNNPSEEKPPLPQGVFVLPSLGSQVTFSQTPIDPKLLNAQDLKVQHPPADQK